MFKFLCLASILGVGLGAFAQENALFPELAKPAAESPKTQQAPAVVPPEEVPSLFNNESADSKAQAEMLKQLNEDVKAETAGKLLESDLNAGAAAQAQQQETSKDQFIISPSSVQIVKPSVSRFQFCMATLTLTNDTKVTLRGLGTIVHYTPIDMPIRFGTVSPGGRTSQKIYMATEACQMLTQLPEVTVESCQAEKMTEEECKSKVKYITDLELVSDTQQ